MPRTVEEILANMDDLAARFEKYDRSDKDELNVKAVQSLRTPVTEQSSAERLLLEAIQLARKFGMSWASISTFVTASGEAARQQYRKHTA